MFYKLLLIFFVQGLTRVLATNAEKYCNCIPFWECKIDSTLLVDNEDGIVEFSPVSKSSCRNYYDVCCKIACGFANTSPTTFNKPDEFPWLARIFGDNEYQCSGTVIHPYVVLTIAHCIKFGPYYTITAGSLRQQHREVEDIIIHPSYQFDASALWKAQNDIALLIVNEAFTLADNVGVICLPHSVLHLTKSTCTAAGWYENTINMYRKREFPLVPSIQCEAIYRRKLHQGFMCAGGTFDCKGDGGSPLMCSIQGEMMKYQLIGIVSWGPLCDKPYQGYYPIVFVDLLVYLKWVDEVIDKMFLGSEVNKIE